MKFYYQDKLVRTSKNHIYTHAVIDQATNKLIGCRSTKEAAEAVKSSEISRYRTDINNCKRAIKEYEAGKSYYFVKIAGRSCPIKFGSKTPKDFEEYIKSDEANIERVTKDWIVVELEAREK